MYNVEDLELMLLSELKDVAEKAGVTDIAKKRKHFRKN